MDPRLLGMVVVWQVACELRYFEVQRCCGTQSVAAMAQTCSVLLDLRNPTRGVEGHMRHIAANRAQRLRDDRCAGYSIEVLDSGCARLLRGNS